MKKAVFFITLFMVVLIVSGCMEKEPVRLGFVAALSGKFSGMGIEEKNGVILAVEEINEAGGINGRTVEVIFKDDENDVAAARKAVEDLGQEGVQAIIGHMTSTITLSTQDLIDEMKILMISPSASTDQLSGKDNYFYRVVESSKTESEHQAHHARMNLGLETIAAVYDVSNEVYAKGWIEAMLDAFEEKGGRNLKLIPFDSRSGDTYLATAQLLMEENPDCITFAMGAIDSALLCQQIRKMDRDIVLISSGWAKTTDFLSNGGASVEGVFFSEMFSPDSRDPLFLQFRENFLRRFGYEPNFPGAHAYECVKFLEIAFSQQNEKETLKESADRIDVLRGLQGEIRFDSYGDVNRDRVMIVVENGKFRRIDNL